MRSRSETLIFQYYEELMRNAYGPAWIKILEILGETENGLCGVETTYATFPGLLRQKGIEPTRSYVSEYGQPKEDGKQAATPAQRRIIKQTLEKAGFKMK